MFPLSLWSSEFYYSCVCLHCFGNDQCFKRKHIMVSVLKKRKQNVESALCVCPVPPCTELSTNVNNNRYCSFRRGWGPLASSFISNLCFLSPTSEQKASVKKTVTHRVPFLCTRLTGPLRMFFPQTRGWIWTVVCLFISSLLILPRQTFHCAEQRGCRNQRSESLGARGS